MEAHNYLYWGIFLCHSPIMPLNGSMARVITKLSDTLYFGQSLSGQSNANYCVPLPYLVLVVPGMVEERYIYFRGIFTFSGPSFPAGEKGVRKGEIDLMEIISDTPCFNPSLSGYSERNIRFRPGSWLYVAVVSPWGGMGGYRFRNSPQCQCKADTCCE